MYDHFKVYSNFKHIFDMFHTMHKGRKRFVYIFDEGKFCENAHFLGFSTIYINTEEHLQEVMKILNTIPMSRNNCIIFPCCYKAINEGIEAVIDDNGRVIKNAWKSIFTHDKTRQYYLCNPDDFESALVTLSDKYKSEKNADISAHKFSEIEVKETEWLRYPYIAKGNITILYAASRLSENSLYI